MKRKTTIMIIGLLSMQLLAASRNIFLVECSKQTVQEETLDKTKVPVAASEDYPEITPLAVTLFQI